MRCGRWCGPSWSAPTRRDRPVLPVILPEIAQIRRRLVLDGWHQQAVAAEEIDLLADADVNIAFAANLMSEPDRLVRRRAPERLVDHPGAGQCMVRGADVVVEQVRVGLVEIDSFV